MIKSKQYNFYVHPIRDKEIKEYLDSIPRMSRSNLIKVAISSFKGFSASTDPIYPVTIEKPLSDLVSSSVIEFTSDPIEISLDDI